MNCRSIELRILETVGMGMAPAGPEAEEMEGHLATCDQCRHFRAVQEELDRRLSRALPAPELSPAFRSNLRRQLRREPQQIWPERLPDVVHLCSCGAATLVCAGLLPVPAIQTLGIGTLVTGATYLLQTIVRNLWEELEEGSR